MIFRVLTLLVYFFWTIWWWITSPSRAKNQVRQRNGAYLLSKYANFAISFLIVLQLLGLSLLPIKNILPEHNFVSFCIFLLGIFVSSKGRLDLGANWTPGYNYQIKNGQTLTTSGIYQFIRHPIYAGILLVYIGAEMIALSYLSVLFVLLVVPIYWQVKKEEKLLQEHFGKQYQRYAAHSKVFIPYLF